jgi:hypothetical protein
MKATFSIEIDGADAIVKIEGQITPHVALCAIHTLLMTQSASDCECAACTTIEVMEETLKVYFEQSVSKLPYLH